MAVTGDIEADESEQDTTDSDSSKYSCAFCGHNYKLFPRECCEHLLCKVESIESHQELLSAPDHPVVATLFGMEVPRVVAGRFMSYLRNQSRAGVATSSSSPSYVHTNDVGVRSVDLLGEKRSHPSSTSGRLVVIKCSSKNSVSFCERTFYLAQQPAEYVSRFLSFVKKVYCSGGDDEHENMVPFSRVHLCNEIMVMDAIDLVPELYQAGTWVMVEGLPDSLPLFFFAVTTPTTDERTVMLINHSANLGSRMKNWNDEDIPSFVPLHRLSRLPTVVIN